MYLISHRGNLNGVESENENNSDNTEKDSDIENET